jgi:hypothetical protein
VVGRPFGLPIKRKSGTAGRNFGGALGSEKSSEERSPRVWRAEKGFQGSESLDRREGSQTLRVELLKDLALSFKRSVYAGRRKGFSGLNML